MYQSEGKMNRKELIDTLKQNRVEFTKVRFYHKSPYQKARYKPEYVGWEAWVYNNKMPCGFLISQQGWENEVHRQIILESI